VSDVRCECCEWWLGECSGDGIVCDVSAVRVLSDVRFVCVSDVVGFFLPPTHSGVVGVEGGVVIFYTDTHTHTHTHTHTYTHRHHHPPAPPHTHSPGRGRDFRFRWFEVGRVECCVSYEWCGVCVCVCVWVMRNVSVVSDGFVSDLVMTSWVMWVLCVFWVMCGLCVWVMWYVSVVSDGIVSVLVVALWVLCMFWVMYGLCVWVM